MSTVPAPLLLEAKGQTVYLFTPLPAELGGQTVPVPLMAVA
jgi:hypothetical protein